jgi:hypothetical protein
MAEGEELSNLLHGTRSRHNPSLEKRPSTVSCYVYRLPLGIKTPSSPVPQLLTSVLMLTDSAP